MIGLRLLIAILGLTVIGAGGWLLSPPGQRLLADPANAAPEFGVDVVDIPDSGFVPSVVSVPVGTTVTWTFTDETAHNVVFDDGPASEVIARGGSWKRTFDVPGNYPYSCTLHTRMDGRVLVTG